MDSELVLNGSIRRLSKDEDLPYSLLLLADETMEAIERYIHTSEIHVYEINNGIIAVLVLQIINDDIVEIKNIAVSDEYQGRGIGTFLLKKASETAAERGFKSLMIGTGDHSVKQLALYQKSGFVKFKIIEDFFINNYPEPIFENGSQLKDMVLLKKDI